MNTRDFLKRYFQKAQLDYIQEEEDNSQPIIQPIRTNWTNFIRTSIRRHAVHEMRKPPIAGDGDGGSADDLGIHSDADFESDPEATRSDKDIARAEYYEGRAKDRNDAARSRGEKKIPDASLKDIERALRIRDNILARKEARGETPLTHRDEIAERTRLRREAQANARARADAFTAPPPAPPATVAHPLGGDVSLSTDSLTARVSVVLLADTSRGNIPPRRISGDVSRPPPVNTGSDTKHSLVGSPLTLSASASTPIRRPIPHVIRRPLTGTPLSGQGSVSPLSGFDAFDQRPTKADRQVVQGIINQLTAIGTGPPTPTPALQRQATPEYTDDLGLRITKQEHDA